MRYAGDIHSGKEYGTQAYDLSLFNQLKTLKAPQVYTLTDNEWANCGKIKEGGSTSNAATDTIDYKLNATGNQFDYAGDAYDSQPLKLMIVPAAQAAKGADAFGPFNWERIVS